MNGFIECNWRLGLRLDISVAVCPRTLIPQGDFWLAAGKNLCEADADDPLVCAVKHAMMVMLIKTFKKCL
jgi:hypothetical protein